MINGKVYIGQTIRDLMERWGEHQRPDSNSIISKAIRKYGVENFTIEQIDLADDLEELNKREIEWINNYKSVVPNGYNLLSGGGGVGKHHSTSIQKMSKSMMGRLVSEQHRKSIAKAHSIPIYQYNLKGAFIKEWTSAMEVSRNLKIGNSELNKCCNGRRHQSGGFQWSYKKIDNIGPIKKRSKPMTKGRIGTNVKPVAKIDAHGNVLETYKSATEAALKNNCDHSSVCKVCNKKLKHIKNLFFIFLKDGR